MATIIVVTVAVGSLQLTYRRSNRSPVLPYVVNLVVLVSLLLHAEYCLRRFFPGYVVPEIYQAEGDYYFNRPLLHLTFKDSEYETRYVTNVQGIRVKEGANPKQRIERADWIFIGDSFTQGAQVPFEAVYTSILYRAFPDRIVINLGTSGLGIAEELSLYRARGAPLRPNVVFLEISPFNDFMNVAPRTIGPAQWFIDRSALYRSLSFAGLHQDPQTLPLRRWTEPFYPDRTSNQRFNVFYRESDPAKERDLDLFGRYLAEFRDAVEGDGAKLVVVLLPSREQVLPEALAEVQTAFGIESTDLDMLRPNRLVADLARGLGIRFVDTYQNLRDLGESGFFERDEHLTAQGHAAAAEGIRDAVATWADRPILRAVSTRLDGERYPQLCCHGTRLSYQAPERGSTEIFSLDLAARGTSQLTVDGLPKSHPMLSGDCHYLVYTLGDAEQMGTKVVLVRLDTGHARFITLDRFEYGAIPFFSPDDKYVAFAGWQRSPDGAGMTNPVIVVEDLASGLDSQVTEDQYESWRPVFSPDGGKLAFIAKPHGQFDIYLHDLSTGTTRQLTDTPYDEWDPMFSTSGREVAYAGHQDDNWDLFEIDVESGQSKRLTQTKGNEWDPVYGPGDRTVFFAGEYGSFAGIYELTASRAR